MARFIANILGFGGKQNQPIPPSNYLLDSGGFRLIDSSGFILKDITQ
jgi:hypothetical protein